MLDISYIRQNPEEIKEACRLKQLDESIVEDLLTVDKNRRELQAKTDKLRRQANDNAKAMKEQVAKGSQLDQSLIAKGREIKADLKTLEPEVAANSKRYQELLLTIPNVPASDVPAGKGEEDNQVVRQEGKKTKFNFEPKSHEDLMLGLNWLDTKRAAKIAGFRAYFLKNEGLILERSLLSYALDLMKKHEFEIMSVPTMVNKEAMLGTGYFPWGADDHYFTQDGQILAGTAEVALTSYYGDETLREKDLPIKLCGISPCYRREIGAHGQDTKGIVRVHQFNKVEQVVLTVADEEEARAWHEKMLAFSEELLKGLGLPYQVLLMCSGDMGAGQRKKYDLETWFPSQNRYRETHSASYFNDFQSRRLNIRYQASDGSTKYVYTLNNTVAASPRLLAAIVENYQKEDATIEIPEVLKKYWI